MPDFDLILPWIACALTLTAFFFVRRWVQRHLFGMGWLVAQEQHLATVIYCIVLLPGIFIHEASHWVLAGIFNVRTHRITAWPKADAQGRVDLSFIKVKDSTNPIFLILIGSAPFAIGFALILWISGNVLHLPDFIKAVNTGNIQVIGLALQNLISQPDFVLWFYLMFTISNTLWPEDEDRRGWLIIIGIVIASIIGLAVIGFQNAVIRWFSGPIPQGLNNLTTIFLTMLVIDSVVAVGLWILERSTERVTHRYAPYRQATALVVAKSNKAAANVPRLSSIMQYQFPLPPAPRKADQPAVTAGESAPGLPRPKQPGLEPGSVPRSTPELPPGATRGGGETARPGLQPTIGAGGPQSRPGTGPSPAFGMSTNASAPGSSRPALPAPGSAIPERSPGSGQLGQSGQPLRPASATGSSPGNPGFSSRPALPASTSAPGSSGSALSPVSGGAPRPSAPVSSSGSPASNTPRGGLFNAASPNRNEDYIDAEVIEDDEPTTPPARQESPGNAARSTPGQANPSGEPLFIDPDAGA